MPNLTRKKIRREVGSLDLSYTTIKDLREQLDYYAKQYGEDAEIDMTSAPYDEYEYVGVFEMGLENDLQYNHRIANETMWELETQNREQAELKRLQAKYATK
jgi:uncharacterized lipoprotein YehR (DUF1307 family)